MKRTVFALAVAAVTLAAVTVSQAAPIAPLPAGTAADQGNLTHVQYMWHGHSWAHCGWWHGHHRHCW
jgi:hypothetical protein